MLLFEYGFDSPQFGTVLFSVVAAFLSLFLVDRPPSARKTGARAVAIALLAVLSLIQDVSLLLTAGLLVFAAAQAFLVQDDERATKIGLICLPVGQLIYGVFLFGYVRLGEVAVTDTSVIAGGLALIVATGVFARTVGFGALRKPEVSVYLAVAVVSCVFALLARIGGAAIGCFLLACFAGATVALEHRKAISSTPAWSAALLWAIFYVGQLFFTLALTGLL